MHVLICKLMMFVVDKDQVPFRYDTILSRFVGSIRYAFDGQVGMC